MAFLDYGDVPIFNNLTENAILPFGVGCSMTVSKDRNPVPLCVLAGGNSLSQRY